MSKPPANAEWRLVGSMQTIDGFAFGSRYPVVLASIAGRAMTEAQLAAIATRLRAVLPALDHIPEPPVTAQDRRDRFRRSVEWLLTTINRLQLAAKVPVHERGLLLTCADGQARIALTATGGMLGPSARTLQAVLGLMQAQAAPARAADPLAPIAQAVAELQRARALSPNVSSFVRAAFDTAVPFQALPGPGIQFGVGRRGRWIDSSFTDETPFIAVALAKRKQWAAQVLRRAGIPVPDHIPVEDAIAALRAAERLGYPVVVKPADLDGGVGVAAGLLAPDEVEIAFHAARRHSADILVEKHVDGRDYRVLMFRGEIVAAIERMPGGITGDGTRTVRELVDSLNADPRRGDDVQAPLKRLALDDEATLLLRRSDLDPASVPESGRFVRLRRAANIVSGGMPVAVLDRIHPDNAALVARAAAALRLDLAGIDLLIPDIARSWHDTGAAICDMNAQPSLGQITTAHVCPHILRRLVPGDGRIPTAVVLGDASDGAIARGLEALLLRDGVVAGCHDAAGVRVNGQTVMQGAVTPHAAGLALCVDPSVGAIVLSIGDDSLLRTGLPLSRFDVLVLAGATIAGSPALAPALRNLLAAVVPACDGTVVTIENSGLALQGFLPAPPTRWRHLPADPGQVFSVLLDAMRTAEARHVMTPVPRTAPGEVGLPLTASKSAAL